MSRPQRRPRFWVGPLVAGSCFALGFGITHRIVAIQAGASGPRQQVFDPQPFPGESLQRLRDRFAGELKPLQADVAALEAELVNRRLAAEAQRQEQQMATRLTPEPLSPVLPSSATTPALLAPPAPITP
ncbi:MAG: hypothetical protein ACON4T_02320 [Synechococcus sp.]